jgi:translation initiation factor 3 subunit E
LSWTQIYQPTDVLRAKYEIARKTNMADFAIGIYRELHGDDATAPPELEATRARVQEQWQALMVACGPLVELVDDGNNNPPAALTEMLTTHTFTPEHLADAYGVTPDHIEALYDWAKFRYECGEYDVAASLLGYYRTLAPMDSARSVGALWGKFAAEILNTRWDEAALDRELLRGALSKAGRGTDAEVLQQRTWLLHWSLFVFANHPKGREALIDFYLQESNLNTIQLNAPWLLRYLVAVVLTSKKRHIYVKTLLRIISQEAHNYRDPVCSALLRSCALVLSPRGRRRAGSAPPVLHARSSARCR